MRSDSRNTSKILKSDYYKLSTTRQTKMITIMKITGENTQQIDEENALVINKEKMECSNKITSNNLQE